MNLPVLCTLGSVPLSYMPHGHNLVHTISLEGHYFVQVSLGIREVNWKIPGKTSARILNCM